MNYKYCIVIDNIKYSLVLGSFTLLKNQPHFNLFAYFLNVKVLYLTILECYKCKTDFLIHE